MDTTNLPICVDLDGSLSLSDLLIEHSILVLKKSPWLIVCFPFWMAKGPLFFKQQLLRLSPKNPNLVFRADLLAYLKAQKSLGRKIYLATASRQEWATQVSDLFPGLFTEVFASNADVNLKSVRKADLLSKEFGLKSFVYVGDSPADFAVFEASAACIPVGSKKFIKQVREKFAIESSFANSFPLLKSWVKAIRVHQWAKNALIFLPVLLAHNFTQDLLISAGFAFFSFSLMASSIYIVNDILDLDSDRDHHKKKTRPFASGALSPVFGIFVSLVLLLCSFSISTLLPEKFQLVLTLYFITTSVYSFYLKSRLLFDVVTLAGLFTLRIFAGSAATGIFISEWLLIFSIFIFFSLALLKRYIEILRLKEDGKEDVAGRAYQVGDRFMIAAIGVSSGLMAVLVSGIYMNQSVALQMYSNPKWLIGINILIMYWISRIWILAERSEVNEDPIVFALKDRQSIVIAIVSGFILWMAS